MTGLSERTRLEHAYRALGILPNSSALEIRRAYRRLARTWHPDTFPQDSPQQRRAAERMREINDAYESIKHAPLRYRVETPPHVRRPTPPPTSTPTWTPTPESVPRYTVLGIDVLEYVMRFVVGFLVGACVGVVLFLRHRSLNVAISMPFVTAVGAVMFGDRAWYWYLTIMLVWL